MTKLYNYKVKITKSKVCGVKLIRFKRRKKKSKRIYSFQLTRRTLK